MKSIIFLLIHVAVGLLYHNMAAAHGKDLRRLALIFKIALLGISFLLEFLREDFILIGQIAIGDPVLWLLLFEISDAIIDYREKNAPKRSK